MNQSERCPWCGSEISRAKFTEVTARIRADEQRKAQAQESLIRQRLEDDHRVKLENEKKKAVKAGRDEMEKLLKSQVEELRKAAQSAKEAESTLKSQLETQKNAVKAAQKETEKLLKSQLDEQRSVLASDHDKQLAKKDAEHKQTVEKLRAELKDLGRRLEKKTPNELGDGPEVDLFETLKGEFAEDYVERVKRGEAGADIHQTVKHRGENCGILVYDSKNRLQWKYEYAKKLRQDKIAAAAEHAILSTNVFPTGKRELCIEEDVIVVNPARVIHIARILRDVMIKMHKLTLSIKERKTKVEQIYQLITSDEYTQKLTEAVRIADGILNLDVKEKKEHDKTWKERGMLATNLKRVLNEIDDDVYTILGGKGSDDFDKEAIAQQVEVPF